MIRAISDWTQTVREPFWAHASLCSPRNAEALVVLAHNETGEHRKLVRRKIAEHLAAHNIACCAVGLTKPNEHVAGRMILDTETLADRLGSVVEFMAEIDDTRGLPVAVFGEDYCGAAALMVGADRTDYVKAAGAYCGRTDLARVYLPRVTVPTLLIVPGRDRDLLARNEDTFAALACASQIAVIGNATETLAESGAMHACRYLIRRWCEQHVVRSNYRAVAC